jgi:L-ascorbate metabolism protein UlaG (beta-lactamase superfamily)
MMETERERARRKMGNWLAHLWREWMVESRRPIAPAFAKPTPATWSSNDLTAAWLGHATVLINFFGVWIITDPVFSSRIGIRLPFLTVGPKRLTAPALTFAELPPIDLVILSHAHFDHIDRPSLKLFGKNTRVITAARTRDLLRGTKFGEVIELDWNKSLHLELRGMDLEILAFRAQHWGARMQYDEHRHYNSYVISGNDRRIIYAGDTAMTDTFAKLHDGKPFDLAIMSIVLTNRGFARTLHPSRPWPWPMRPGHDLSCPFITRHSGSVSNLCVSRSSISRAPWRIRRNESRCAKSAKRLCCLILVR